jgi:hypothetical protein
MNLMQNDSGWIVFLSGCSYICLSRLRRHFTRPSLGKLLVNIDRDFIDLPTLRVFFTMFSAIKTKLQKFFTE